MADVAVKPLPFDEAVRAFNRRAPHLIPTDRWTAMWAEEHATAFTVARSAGYDILGDISNELRKALEQGTTFEQFAANLKPMLQAKGWWGKSEEVDGSTVQLGSMSRLKTIYNSNMRVSYSAGAWERAQRTKKVLPYLVYEGIRDGRQRPAHRAWTGTVKPVDDPWWDTHMPPCGWNCRCFVRQLSATKAEAMPTFGQEPQTGPATTFTNSTTGEKVKVPWGIDPGWGYNPGKAALEGDANALAAKTMADKLAAAPPRVAALPIPAATLDAMAREFADWVEKARSAQPAGDLRVVGALGDKELDHLYAKDLAPQSGAITASDQVVHGMLRDLQSRKATALDLATIRGLPRYLASPAAVLWDADEAVFIYVLDVAGAKDMRVAVRVDRSVFAPDRIRNPAPISMNAIRSGQLVPVRTLRRYQVIEGKL